MKMTEFAGSATNALDDKRHRHLVAIQDNRESVFQIIKWMRDDLPFVKQLWGEISREDQLALYGLSPTNGSIFTTPERDIVHTL